MHIHSCVILHVVQVRIPDGAEDQQAGANDGRLRAGASGCRGLSERVRRQRSSNHRHAGDAQSSCYTTESIAVRAESKHRFHYEEYRHTTWTVPHKTGCCSISCMFN